MSVSTENPMAAARDGEERTVSGGSALETDSLKSGTPAKKSMSRCDIAKRVAIVVAVLVIIIYVVVDSFTTRHVITLLEDFLKWVKDAGALGPIVFAIVYMVGTVIFLPGSILTLGSGFAFAQAFGQGLGILVASLVVLVGATAGACLAFLLGRYALRSVVQEKASKYRILKAVDKALEGQGLLMVILLRLSPVIPFNAFNYFMGLTGVHFIHYLIGSVGMIPGTVAFVYFGSLISDIKNAVAGKTDNSDPAVKWTVFACGIVATVVAVILISVYAKKQLNKFLLEEDANKAAAVADPGSAKVASSTDAYKSEPAPAAPAGAGMA